MEQVKKLIADNKVFVFAKSYCPYCKKAKEALASINVEFGLLDLDKYIKSIIILFNRIDNGDVIQAALAELTGRKTVPNVFVNGQSIGGGDDTVAKVQSGELQKLLA